MRHREEVLGLAAAASLADHLTGPLVPERFTVSFDARPPADLERRAAPRRRPVQSRHVSALVLVYVGLGALGPVFAWLEGSGPPPRRSVRLDALYWLLTPLLTGVLTRGLVVGLTVVALALAGEPATPAGALERLAAIDPLGLRVLPRPVLAVVALLALDLLSYVSHRVRHAVPLLAALHTVHHAPADLDWRAAARMHPLDDLVDNAFVFFPLLALGVPAAWVLLAGPLLLLHTIYLHARLPLSLGPLDGLVATPAFHRAHHAAVGPIGNFGGLLSVWDRVFGTARPPSSAVATGLPARLALRETLLDQLVTPLVRWWTDRRS